VVFGSKKRAPCCSGNVRRQRRLMQAFGNCRKPFIYLARRWGRSSAPFGTAITFHSYSFEVVEGGGAQ